MLIALSGVTGIGKTYYTEKFAEKLGLKKLNTIRTRERRNNENGIFMSEEELDKKIKNGEIAVCFETFGSRYAYLKKEVFSDDVRIFEMHYTHVHEWKKVCNDLVTIYIFPKDIEDPIKRTYERKLKKEKEDERILEIREQFEIMTKDLDLREKFDYFFYNEYDEKSENELFSKIKEILKK